MTIFTPSLSVPSIAITVPRTARAGEPAPGVDSGGEILARTFILLSGGIDMTIASTDLACSDTETLDVWRGARVRDVS